MIYQVRINKRVGNVKVYSILKKIGSRENFLTKLFIKLFNQQASKENERSAMERLK
jgi:hypothetical protein